MMYWIRSSVKRSQVVQSRVITVPQRLYENHKRLIRTEKELRAVLGRRPSKMELGAAVGMSEIQVELANKKIREAPYKLKDTIFHGFPCAELSTINKTVPRMLNRQAARCDPVLKVSSVTWRLPSRETSGRVPTSAMPHESFSKTLW